MGYDVGQRRLASIRRLVDVGLHSFPTGWAQVTSCSPGSTMDRQNSHRKLSRRDQVNTKGCTKEIRTKLLPGHVARAMNPHELVMNSNPSIQEGKEAAGHTTGHQ